MKKTLIVLSLLALSFLLICCGHDKPPEANTPEPPAHAGTFSSEYGSFTFNGDGKSVTVKASKALADATGLPEGECEGTYVFLFHNEMWRYDKAETFRVTVGDERFTFISVPDSTNEGALCLILPDGVTVTFTKEAE